MHPEYIEYDYHFGGGDPQQTPETSAPQEPTVTEPEPETPEQEAEWLDTLFRQAYA